MERALILLRPKATDFPIQREYALELPGIVKGHQLGRKFADGSEDILLLLQ